MSQPFSASPFTCFSLPFISIDSTASCLEEQNDDRIKKLWPQATQIALCGVVCVQTTPQEKPRARTDDPHLLSSSSYHEPLEIHVTKLARPVLTKISTSISGNKPEEAEQRLGCFEGSFRDN
ncbi:hypothetical protein PCANC_04593 [Puccinia coronata f. sp. avenae]|uniref:Uncharacterized protein n=1 Tax=Puccinia coronata f. sp. avenae TaxID=200324 RepID=A0A2N5W0E1_9BASI|nr:hypothetical protein PCANC_04593 [Puccinia coronata f. sp. avenae]